MSHTIGPAAPSRTPAGGMLVGGALTYRDGRLFVEDCDAGELAAGFGTPLHVVSEARLRANVRDFIERFSAAWPEGPVGVLASIKANYSLALRRILTQEGAGCDTFGLSELRAALSAGVPPGSISVNGTAKPARLIHAAVGVGAPITLDNAAELALVERAARELGRVAAVRVRLRPDYAALTQASEFFPDESIGAAATQYKPGVPAGDDIALVRRALQTDGVVLAGCHAHIGRHSGALDMWRGMLRAYVARIAAVRDATGWEPACTIEQTLADMLESRRAAIR